MKKRMNRWGRGCVGIALGLSLAVVSGCDSLLDVDLPAQLTDDGTGKYTGSLVATTGTYFGNPWQGYVPDTSAGTATFAPSDTYHAMLTYSLNGGPTVSKPIQRQTLTQYVLAGNYSGSMVGSVSGCADAGANIPQFHGRYNLAVTQNGDQSASLTFTFTDTTYAGLVCTLNGALNHLGRLYQMPSGAANCAGGGNINTGPFVADLEGFHPTGQGIEGRWTADFGAGCAGAFRFSAVLRGG